MICHKCGFGHMVDDSHHDIRAFKCWVCGDRIYPDHAKRSGALVCSRCGGDMYEKNALNLCENCLNLLNIHADASTGVTMAKPSTPAARRS
jgi:formylmethanofuran dehydrogenase subunit E